MRGTGKWDVVNLFDEQNVGYMSREFLPQDYVDEYRSNASWKPLAILNPMSDYGLPDDELVEVEIYK